jgi:pyridoxal phosphate enzyme (YggS family)
VINGTEQDPGSALVDVRRRIAAACDRAGRDPASVTLVAISKTFPVERIRMLISAGHDVLGENRVQEALAKIDEIGPGPRWHLVGTLQRNKAKDVVGRFELIHSLDSERLADELDRRASQANRVQPVLVQVNQGGEPTKSGIAPERVSELVDAVLARPCLALRGLMTVPPPESAPERSRRWFSELRELRDREEHRCQRRFPDLSMGMTDDFEVAIEEGATLVRVGRALFGERR